MPRHARRHATKLAGIRAAQVGSLAAYDADTPAGFAKETLRSARSRAAGDFPLDGGERISQPSRLCVEAERLFVLHARAQAERRVSSSRAHHDARHLTALGRVGRVRTCAAPPLAMR